MVDNCFPRFVENDLLLTFVSGQYAVEAVKEYDNYKVMRCAA